MSLLPYIDLGDLPPPLGAWSLSYSADLTVIPDDAQYESLRLRIHEVKWHAEDSREPNPFQLVTVQYKHVLATSMDTIRRLQRECWGARSARVTPYRGHVEHKTMWGAVYEVELHPVTHCLSDIMPPHTQQVEPAVIKFLLTMVPRHELGSLFGLPPSLYTYMSSMQAETPNRHPYAGSGFQPLASTSSSSASTSSTSAVASGASTSGAAADNDSDGMVYKERA